MSGMMKPLKTFEDLEATLRHWMSFADPHLYDAGGMVLLFGACLDKYLSICFFIALSWRFVGAEQEKMKLLLVKYLVRQGALNAIFRLPLLPNPQPMGHSHRMADGIG